MLFHTVTFDGERVGTIYLQRDLKDMGFRLTEYTWIMLVVLVLSWFASFILCSQTQKLISGPIDHLTETAGRVISEHNYSIRAERRSDDEIAILVDRFNEMMERILQRDRDLQKAQDELEDRVSSRTMELRQEIRIRERTESELRKATFAAEESNRAKSSFLATMSHELRTPLNAIIGYSEMLEEDAAEAGQGSCVEDLRKIKKAGRHLLSLINEALDLSKVEAGRMEVFLKWVNVSEMLSDAADTARPLAAKNGNQLLVERHWQGEEFYTDPTKFRQSLFNLLSNACKFTENGTVKLELDSEQADGKEWLLWRVQDTGIGISQEQSCKLFKPFSQIDASIDRKYSGTGLGLAISQKLCQLLGGRIDVSSEPGKGSTFTIRHAAGPDPNAQCS